MVYVTFGPINLLQPNQEDLQHLIAVGAICGFTQILGYLDRMQVEELSNFMACTVHWQGKEHKICLKGWGIL